MQRPAHGDCSSCRVGDGSADRSRALWRMNRREVGASARDAWRAASRRQAAALHDPRRGAARRRVGAYFVPPLDGDDVEGGVEGEVLGDVVEPDGGEGDVDGVVVVGGDADGVRSPGRSPTRSLRDSVHPASTPVPRARTHTPMSNFFIAVLLWALIEPRTVGCNASATEL